MSEALSPPAAVPANAPGDAPTRLQGRWRLLARAAWLAVVGLTVSLYVLSVFLNVARPMTLCTTPPCDPSQFTPADVQRLQQQGISVEFLTRYYAATDVLFVLVYVSVALVIFSRKSDDWMAMLVALMLVTFSTATFSNSLNAAAASYPALNVVSGVISQIGAFCLFLFFFLFPDGRFVPRWTRWLFLLVIGLGVVSAIFPDSPFGGNGAGLFIGFGSILFVQIYRYARVSGTEERQQTKWVVFGTTVALGGFAALILLLTLAGVNPEASRTPSVFVSMLVNAALRIFLALIPLSLMVAILRYRLWEIDLLINRTLVYVPLTAIIAGIFAASITLSQKLFIALTGQSSDAATVLTTLIVVAAVDPVKTGLQHLVDRRFKEAPDPAKQMQAFSAQVQAVAQVLDSQRLARRLLDEAMCAFGATGGAVYLGTGEAERLLYAAGDWKGEAALEVVMENDGRRLGRLALGPRRGGEKYGAPDRATLEKAADIVAETMQTTAGRPGGSL